MTKFRRAGSGSGLYVINIESQSISDGNYEFPVGNLALPIDMFLDEFRFVDDSGDAIIPSAGSVLVQVSSDGTFWRALNNGSFSATLDTTSSNYTPPSGLAAVSTLRITLAGVVGASGFKANFVRG